MKTIWLRTSTLLFTVAVLSATGRAAVRHVPTDYNRIQGAIDAAGNGDVILVDPGLYSESINFKGKAITLSSTNSSDPEVVKRTIIRAVGQTSTVSFISGESSNSVLAGLTITGGYGTINPDFGTDLCWGGGIYCKGSSPTIVGNIIVANAGPDGSASVAGYGPGIACIESDAVIARNLILANTGYAGGGILAYLGNARITSNVICSNSVVVGGGIAIISGSRVINNTLVANSAQFAGNVYVVSDAAGQSVVANNLICSAVAGGGVYVDVQDNITRVAFNDVWNNAGGDFSGGQEKAGQDGNISQDPLFMDAAAGDYHLQDTSPCVNSGDRTFQPAAGELDYYGGPRLYAGRVDIGAAEYYDSYRPVAEAGPDQAATVIALPAFIQLDGSASGDPNGLAVTYHWRQVSGPAVSLSSLTAAQPSFNAPQLAVYGFELTVNNGTFNSFADRVEVTVTNTAPTASAGNNQLYAEGTAAITLDGSGSSDPEQVSLSYQWTQLSGWNVRLSDPRSAKPTFAQPWPGTYVFQLVVSDGLQDSPPAVVRIVVGPNHAPVANAGLSRYVANGSTTLDGTGSYDPDGGGILTYHWRQLSGPTIAIAGADTPAPLLSGFVPKAAIQRCVFELVVNDGALASTPSTVTVTIVPNYGANALYLANPPFDPSRPTIVAFGGGNCTTGSGMSFGGVWDSLANWITVPSYTSAYSSYGDMLMVYLSSVAPDYRMPIQTIGFSTGNKPAMQAAWYANVTYKDARYAVNRVALCDAVCNNLSGMVAQFHANPIDREPCWVDNYISNDSRYSKASYIPGALNVTCSPARSHAYPINRYAASSLDYTNGGLTAFAYLSVIGSGKNYQLNTSSNKYYFTINSAEAITFTSQASYPGKVMAPVQLAGPAHGSTLDTNGAVLSCAPVENAVRYQLLFGSDPYRVAYYGVFSDTTNPPSRLISALPMQYTWWTVKAIDQFGSTIHADPRLLRSPENRAPIADAGPNQVLYAGLDEKTTVTLSGSRSHDPDGDALAYTWAWSAGGTACLSNGVSLTLELPAGTHTIQLMVSDGQDNSTPAEVTVKVVPPLACALKITPSAINLRRNGPHIMAAIRFPEGITRMEAGRNEPLRVYPGSLLATPRRLAGGNGQPVSLVASFETADLAGAVPGGDTELMIVGQLSTGQVFYGQDTVKILGTPKKK